MSTFSKRFRRFFSRSRARGAPRGFTLIELLVVVTLMVVITGAALVRQARFDSSTLLRGLGYSVALSVRSAQVYGTSVLGVTSGGNTVFAPAYGIYFNGPSSYLLFADINNNGAYDAASDSIVQSYRVGSGFKINKFCGVFANGTMHCSTDASPLTWLTVYFKRPSPDALIKSSANETYSGAYVQVVANNDAQNSRSVSVSITGEISVGNSGS